jgi:lipoyl synthase
MDAGAFDMRTIGQHLQPYSEHLPVTRYVHPDTLKTFEEKAHLLGFKHAAVGAMARSSYLAGKQADGLTA